VHANFSIFHIQQNNILIISKIYHTQQIMFDIF